MRLCLFEDGASGLEPLSLTRPVFDLLCGLTTLGDKALRRFAPWSVGVVVRPCLAPLYRRHHPDRVVNHLDWLRAESTILVNGRWLPPAQAEPVVHEPLVALADGELAYAVVGKEHLGDVTLDNLAQTVESWKESLPVCDAGGRMIRHLWDLVEENGRQLQADFPHVTAGRPRGEAPKLHVAGPLGNLFVDPSAKIEPLVVAETSGGPVIIDRGAVVTAFTRLEGPCYIGQDTRLHGAQIRAGVTIGPQCRIGGEVEASIIHGYSNKYHDGFLGHSYVGEWVNLAAGTQTSDLRNDYGEISVTVAGRLVRTGLTKVGCFLGDHVKTGLGTLINTGTNVGIFGGLLPAGPLAPRYVPSFTTWWDGTLRENSAWNRLLETAKTVMQRRASSLTEEHEALFRHIFADTDPDRRRALRDAEQRQWRRGA